MTVPLVARILLADDHEMVRDGLSLVIDAAPDLEVAAVAGDGVEALRTVLAGDFDLAVLDVSMPLMTGIQVAHELSRQRPEVRTLMLSMHDNEQYYLEALKVANRDLIEGCRAALRGSAFVYPSAAQVAAGSSMRSQAGSTALADPLTPREVDVVKLIAEGFTSDEIGELLIISSKTVDRHRANVLEKLEMRNRVELTRYAIRRGLVEA